MTKTLLMCALLGAVVGCAGNDGSAPATTTDAGPLAPDAGADGVADAAAEGGVDGSPTDAGPLTLTSPSFAEGGTLSVDFTCDGKGQSPPLAWSGVPAGTAELALLMTTEAKDGRKWNWVLFGIPATTRSLALASTGVGTCGLTSDGPALAYSPPCSSGPGAKAYTFTLYALSAKPALPAAPKDVTGPVLTAAITPITLASSALTASYTR